MGGESFNTIRLGSIPNSLPEKLKSARTLSGLSTRAVASVLSEVYKIAQSHATIANFESGKSSPNIAVIAALASIYERPLNWFLERSVTLSGVRYRNLKSKVKNGDLYRYEAIVQRWFDAYFTIENKLGRPLSGLDYRQWYEGKLAPSVLSSKVREELRVSESEPIPSIVEVLEHFGVHVLEQPTELSVDGLAAMYGKYTVVALNPNVSNDRVRMNAGHELGHVLFGDCATEIESSIEETRAFDFASHLLLPSSQLEEAFKGKSMVRLVQFKERFGISLAAMVYRAEKSRVITKGEAKSLWIEFAKRGWKVNEPGRVRPDRATRFEQLIDECVACNILTLNEVADFAGVNVDAIRERLNYAMGVESEDPTDGIQSIRLRG